MDNEVVLDQATPEQILEFLRHVSNLAQPCSEGQIAQSLNKKENDTVFVASRNLAVYFDFVKLTEKGIVATSVCRNILNLTGKLQRHYALAHLGNKEPFPSLIRVLKDRKQMLTQEIGLFLSSNFNRNWDTGTRKQMGRIYAHWLDFLQIGSYVKAKGVVEYSLGEIKFIEPLILPGMEAAVSRTLYDHFAERFNTPKNILSYSWDLLNRVDNPLPEDSRDIGERFERFVAQMFWCFGFEPRTRPSFSEDPACPYKDQYGGGDIGLFMHFPIETDEGYKDGFLIACEAKSGESLIGSSAVRQAIDFVNRLLSERGGLFQKYLVHKIIISRSLGYDESGKISAQVSGVIHLNHKALMDILNTQVKLLKEGKNLITPFRLLRLLNRLVDELNFNPEREYVTKIMMELTDLKC